MRPRGNTPRDDWVYQPPDRSPADVKEVWFAGWCQNVVEMHRLTKMLFFSYIGAHSDIGGGSHANTEPGSLSFVPLRWMIKECLIAGAGILFEADVLSKFEFDFDALEKHLGGPAMVQLGFADQVGQKSSAEYPTVDHSDTYISSSPDPPPEPSISSLLLFGLYDKIKPIIREKYGTYFNSLTNFAGSDTISALTEVYNLKATDSLSAIYDQLVMKWAWWTLEWLPTFTTYQTPSGEWMQRRMYVCLSHSEIFLNKI